MKVLFYTELYPIRDNPYEYLNVAKEFSKVIQQGCFDSKLICNDEIYRKLYINGEINKISRAPLTLDIDNWIDRSLPNPAVRFP